MVASVRPFLMFQGEAGAALDLYLTAIPGAQLIALERYGPDRPGPEGKVYQARLRLAGEELMLFDSPVAHAFTFTPAVSFYLDCESEAELERLAAALGEGGQWLMPVGAYGFSRRFGWLADRFGVSWQLNLP